MQLEIHQQKAIEYLLQQQYFNEFEVIDGLDQHPQGLNFYEWLYKKQFISKEHLDNISVSIKEVDFEDKIMNEQNKIIKLPPEHTEFVKMYSQIIELDQYGSVLNVLRMKLADVSVSEGLFKVLSMTDDELLETFVKQVAEMRKLQKEYFKTRDIGILEKSKQHERYVDQLIEDISKPKLF